MHANYWWGQIRCGSPNQSYWVGHGRPVLACIATVIPVLYYNSPKTVTLTDDYTDQTSMAPIPTVVTDCTAVAYMYSVQPVHLSRTRSRSMQPLHPWHGSSVSIWTVFSSKTETIKIQDRLRSSQSNQLIVPPVKLSTYGMDLARLLLLDLSSGTTLPEYLHDPELSIDNFRRQLKTFLFAQYWRCHPSALETLVPVRSMNLLFAFTLFTIAMNSKTLMHTFDSAVTSPSRRPSGGVVQWLARWLRST